MLNTWTIDPSNWVKGFILKKNQSLLLLFIVVLLTSCVKDIDEPATVTVFATGLNNPRGLKFGPDGLLYVAESGLGGTEVMSDKCPELVPVFGGPFKGSTTGGRISRFSSKGVRTTVTNKLPTTISNFGDVFGPSDIAFIGSTLYAVVNAGCGRSVPSVPVSIVRINSSESFTVIADLGAYRLANPVAQPPTGDIDPEGSFYSMISVGGDLYSLDANHGELVKVTTGGTVTRVIDISKSQGHIVPTALAYKENFYIGNLNVFPIVDGSSNIYKVTPGGEINIKEMGLTAILGLVFDNKGRMYVLETTTENQFPTPGSGRIVRINPDGSKKIIATGFSNPAGLAYGPDGNLYVSNWGFGGDVGSGAVLKVRIKDKDNSYPH